MKRKILLALFVIMISTIHGQMDSPMSDDSTVVDIGPKKPWYFYENKHFTASPVVALALDVTKFNQDANSLQQVGDQSKRYEPGQIRAIRVGVIGQFKFRIPWTYMFSAGYRAFDVGFDTDSAATFTIFDLRIDIPTMIGTFAIGMMKEPISMQKIMPGAFLPGIERPMQLEGLLPSRNIGIQWIKSLFGRRGTISLGWFNNWLQTGNSFSDNRDQFVGRFTFIPLDPYSNKHLIHFAIAGRYSNWKETLGRAKATPEAYFASNYVDTGEFTGESSSTFALEAVWTYGPFWVGSEYVGSYIKSSEAGDPFFNGLNIDFKWAITGEANNYLRGVGLFAPVVPKKNVHQGGAGMFEFITRYSKIDLNDSNIMGGELNRWTLGINWYATFFTKFSIHYGYITLDNYDSTGITHIWQTRLMMIL